MEFRHSVGLFQEGKAVKYYDNIESLNVSLEQFNNPLPISRLALKELRKVEYKEKIIHANMLLVKKLIADSVNTDTHIIQAINSIEELDKVCNTLVKRIREWYGYYYPELEHQIQDNETFIKLLLEKSKNEFMVESNQQISMGPDLDSKDLDTILTFARQVDDMYLQRSKLVTYIDNVMIKYCPNMYSLTGAIIGAKLLERARSLKHLAMLPSSTVQLLGAEKALFRHLRNKNIRPPKHGLILSHPLVMGARRDMRGTAARLFASKVSIAAKIDYFHGEFIGDKLLQELEKKLKGK